MASGYVLGRFSSTPAFAASSFSLSHSMNAFAGMRCSNSCACDRMCTSSKRCILHTSANCHSRSHGMRPKLKAFASMSYAIVTKIDAAVVRVRFLRVCPSAPWIHGSCAVVFLRNLCDGQGLLCSLARLTHSFCLFYLWLIAVHVECAGEQLTQVEHSRCFSSESFGDFRASADCDVRNTVLTFKSFWLS